MKKIRLIIALLFFPLSIWYAVGVALRNLYYSKKTIQRLNTLTIGVGNLRVGGTGKTPHTEYLVRLLSDQRIALLSRGYGRKTKGFRLVSETDDAKSVGDEPAMMARRFPNLTVAVCEDRVLGIQKLMDSPCPPQIVLLDDVYQHRSLRPNVNIILTEYNGPYFLDYILPFGNLREFRSGSKRADIVIVTKCPPFISRQRRDEYRRQLHLLPHQQLFFSQITFLQPQPLFHNRQWQIPVEVLLVTGIANPTPLVHHLELQFTVKHLDFPDHHTFNDFDCNRIIHAFNSIKVDNKAIVTTEKDAMRLRNNTSAKLLKELPIYYIPITVTFTDGDTFDKTIINSLLVNNKAD